MARTISRRAALAAALLVAGCVSLEPELPPAEAELPVDWPISPVAAAEPAPAGPVVEVGWRDFFAEPGLRAIIAQALDNNRDLRVAMLNVDRARAQYRIQRSERLPSLDADAALQRGRLGPQPLGGATGGGEQPVSEYYSVELGVTAFELDLFGRVRDLSRAELQRYFATDEARRNAQLALIAEVATTWLTLGADLELLRTTEETVASQAKTLELTQQRYALGAASALDASQALAALEGARAELSRQAADVARGTNALRLLAGGRLDPVWLPGGFRPLGGPMAAVPAGLPSELLLRRPDVISAEHRLRAANADIGAARAAFFPSITLTGSIGSVSDELDELFDSGSDVWSIVPRVRVPVFQGGRLRAGLEMAEADRDIRLAEYERAIQTGFREVADGLALGQTLQQQRGALEARLKAATRSRGFAEARFRAGRDSYFVLLDTERTLYVSRQALILTELAEQTNRIALYKALGGGWLSQEVDP